MRTKLSIFILVLASQAFGADRILVYREQWLEMGTNDTPIGASYIAVEGLDFEDYCAFHFPTATPSEKKSIREELVGRTSTAENLITLIGEQFKRSVRKHGTLTASYEADIDDRLTLAKQGYARFVALLSIDSRQEEFEVYAMAAIFADFGMGAPLQFVNGQNTQVALPPLKKGWRREKVRIFGSAQAHCFDENVALGNLASETELYWSERAVVSFFAVPYPAKSAALTRFRSLFPETEVDWKACLLNLTVADGLLRFGETSVPEHPVPDWVDTDSQGHVERLAAFGEVQRPPFIQPELLGLSPQRKAGITEIVLFTRSETLATLFFPQLGFERHDDLTYAISDDPADSHQYVLRISREDLEFITLEKLRDKAFATNPFFASARVSVAPQSLGTFGDPHMPHFLSRCAKKVRSGG